MEDIEKFFDLVCLGIGGILFLIAAAAGGLAALAGLVLFIKWVWSINIPY